MLPLLLQEALLLLPRLALQLLQVQMRLLHTRQQMKLQAASTSNSRRRTA
jgi:hypothetical protein